MIPFYQQDNITIYCDDCVTAMQSMEDNSVDSIVTDPPYGLSKQPDIVEVLTHWLNDDDYEHTSSGFMGKQWDSFVPGPSVWRECLRVLKPGGHLLAFAGTRTQDLMGISLRLGGFEIRDIIAWVYGSGFPKSLDIGKAIDKVAGAEREVVGSSKGRSSSIHNGGQSIGHNDPITAPTTPEAKQWDGFGTGLKPALEPIILARKPISEKNIAANVLRWGTGGLNIGECRVGTEKKDDSRRVRYNTKTIGGNGIYKGGIAANTGGNIGRFPANLIHDGSEEVRVLFPETKSRGFYTKSISRPKVKRELFGTQAGVNNRNNTHAGDSGSAARFFYCTKSSKAERNMGLEGIEKRKRDSSRHNEQVSMNNGEGNPYNRGVKPVTNHHPTVKPLALMRYLCRLITPPNGIILDPFVGSGSTLIAARDENFKAIGIELEEEYCQIAVGRLAQAQPSLFSVGN